VCDEHLTDGLTGGSTRKLTSGGSSLADLMSSFSSRTTLTDSGICSAILGSTDLDLVSLAVVAAKSPVGSEDNGAKDDEEVEDDEDSRSCGSHSDTSDDASDIPSSDSDCHINDLEDRLDLLDEQDEQPKTAVEGSVAQQDNDASEYDCIEIAVTDATAAAAVTAAVAKQQQILSKLFNQVIEKDGSVVRKTLDSGIYRSVNQTLSLFIEPQDILKRMEASEFDEYLLFPHLGGSEGEELAAEPLDAVDSSI